MTAANQTTSTNGSESSNPKSGGEQDRDNGPTFHGSYDPLDNKLRMRVSQRLDADLYARVRDAGFIWAPKQELFVAPMWTPAREDLLLELCGEIGDEDTSLVERAEERADRFTDYSASRTQDAQRARESVSAITDGIPAGQPILIGHHSERHARKHAEQIENGMRKAISMWETAGYWTRRAAGAIRLAKYKERTDVRTRRIKGLEAEKRKSERSLKATADLLKTYRDPEARGVTLRDGRNMIAALLDTYEGGLSAVERERLRNGELTIDAAISQVVASRQKEVERCERWINHYSNRIAYEQAMIAEQGGLKADGFDLAVGGLVLVRGEWVTIIRLNRVDGRINSVSTNARYVKVRPVEEIKDYRAPSAEDAAKVKAVKTLAPLCNYPGEGFQPMTKVEWECIHADYKGSRELGQGAQRPGSYRMDLKDAETLGAKYARHRVRSVVRAGKLQGVFLTDSKRTDPPAPAAVAPDPVTLHREPEAPAPIYMPQPKTEDAKAFESLRDTLRHGVQVVTAPQLFPTPPQLAARMVDLCGLTLGMRVLEPSAGTGRLLEALPFVVPFGVKRQTGLDVVAVEINYSLAKILEFSNLAAKVICADFLQCNDLGKFEAVLLNPPFASGQDVIHIKHALTFLAPGGRLVAICANGPRQNAILRPLVEACGGSWEVLPPDTFANEGTAVNTVLLSMRAPW